MGSEPSSSRPRCTCGHFRTNHQQAKGRCIILRCECQAYSSEREPREERPVVCDHPDNDPCDRCLMPQSYCIKCGCGHVQGEHRTFLEGGCTNCRCKTFALPPEEPPMTPEEEEQAPEDEGLCAIAHATIEEEEACERERLAATLPPSERAELPPCGACGHTLFYFDRSPCTDPCGAMHYRCRACRAEQVPCALKAPTQPEQRPPYAVAYSVQGHLYEVALSGDATVRAVDGALVIQHHLGPVAGIVQTRPVINERSADGAEAEH